MYLLEPIPRFNLIRHLVIEVETLPFFLMQLVRLLRRMTSLTTCTVDLEADLCMDTIIPALLAVSEAMQKGQNARVIIRHSTGGPSERQRTRPQKMYRLNHWPDNRAVPFLPCSCWRSLNWLVVEVQQVYEFISIQPKRTCADRFVDPNLMVLYQCGYYTTVDNVKAAWNLHPRTLDGQVDSLSTPSQRLPVQSQVQI